MPLELRGPKDYIGFSGAACAREGAFPRGLKILKGADAGWNRGSSHLAPT